MNKQILQLLIVLLFSSISSFAQTSQSAEIVSRQLFGDGLMVTRAKIPPVEGLVSNFFFYNRVDEPWNGQQWQKIDVGGGHYKLGTPRLIMGRGQVCQNGIRYCF